MLRSRHVDLFQQPPSSQERGSGLAVGRQGGPGSTGGPGAVDQARDLSPCLPASMGDAARPTTLPCSPPAAHHHGPHHTPLHQTHCGTNNNCYDGSTTPYDSRDYDSPGGTALYLSLEKRKISQELSLIMSVPWQRCGDEVFSLSATSCFW